MSGYAVKSQAGDATSFVESLGAYSRQHRAKHWAGTFEEFLRDIVPPSPRSLARSSHEYLWDMLCWFGRSQPDADSGPSALFQRELFGIDAPLARVVDYFKGAAAGSDVGRRLLLLLGPPSGGKSTMAILLKRGIEEYSHTDEGAVYALSGSPMHESPLNIVPATLRAEFREKFGVEIRGDAATKGIPVIALTASVTPTDRTAITAAGFDAFLGKPINLKEFLETVRRLVEKSST